MSNVSVVQRLILMVAVSLGMIILLVTTSLIAFSKINDGVGRIYDDRVVPLVHLKQISDGYRIIINAVNKADNGILDPNDALDEIINANILITTNWNKYLNIASAAHDNDATDILDELFNPANEMIAEVAKILKRLGRDMEYDEDGETVITDYNGDLFEFVDPINKNVALLIDINTSAANEERALAQTIFDNVFFAFIVGSVIVFLIMLLSGYFVSKSISEPLRKICEFVELCVKTKDLSGKPPKLSKDEIGSVGVSFEHMMEQFKEVVGDVHNTCKKLDGYSMSLQKSTTEAVKDSEYQSQETQHVVDVSAQLSRASEDISANASKASETVNSVNQDAEAGNINVQKVIVSVVEVKEKMNLASQVVERVANDSHDIGAVLGVIREIAEQTNLLALNAAIEAARAGEQGRGFAVVADEVRSLAQRTRASTETIQSSISRLHSSAGDAVDSMTQGREEIEKAIFEAEQAGSSIQAISTSIALIRDMNMENAKATDDQMRASKEIANNLVNISNATVKSKVTFSQVESDGLSLRQTATQLAARVNGFKT